MRQFFAQKALILKFFGGSDCPSCHPNSCTYAPIRHTKFADPAVTYNFVFLIIKIIPPIAKTQCFVHLSFNSTFQLINDISSDLQTFLRYFNGKEIVVFSKISSALPINLVLRLKDLELLVSAILALKMVASSLE